MWLYFTHLSAVLSSPVPPSVCLSLRAEFSGNNRRGIGASAGRPKPLLSDAAAAVTAFPKNNTRRRDGSHGCQASAFENVDEREMNS